MAAPRIPSIGEQWSASIKTLASVYGQDEDTMAMAVYALAEQMHQHYCLARGLVNHSESRPDQNVAVSVLMTLAGTDWWIVRKVDITRSDPVGALTVEETGPGDDATEG